MRTVAWVVLGLVALERLIELVYAAHNTRRLIAAGAREYGRGHYKFIVALHAGWLLAIAVALHQTERLKIDWLILACFVGLQPMRLWVLRTLGPYWTTRVIRLAGAPIIRRGPFRYVSHPNYTLVVLEIALLPLAFGMWRIALGFSAANLVLLRIRLNVETRALKATAGSMLS